LLVSGALAALPVFAVQAGPPAGVPPGVLNATFVIEKKAVRLVGGRAEVPVAAGSAARVTTMVFGKPAIGDLNGDGRDDAALFLVQDPGGSGAFHYTAAAIARNGTYQGSNAVFLGDRVAPRAIAIRNGVIVAEYTDRRPDQPMAATPTIAKTMHLTLHEGRLWAVQPRAADAE